MRFFRSFILLKLLTTNQLLVFRRLSSLVDAFENKTYISQKRFTRIASSSSKSEPDSYGGFFDGEQKLREIEALDAQMGAPDFWDNNDKAQRHIAKVNGLKKAVLPVVDYRKKNEDIDVMLELIDTGSAEEKAEYSAELSTTVTEMLATIDDIEIASFLTGRFDRNNAIFSIQAGAGGTESKDWADMLFRMYTRWAERRGFKIEVQDVQPGEQAGISKATLLIKG